MNNCQIDLKPPLRNNQFFRIFLQDNWSGENWIIGFSGNRRNRLTCKSVFRKRLIGFEIFEKLPPSINISMNSILIFGKFSSLINVSYLFLLLLIILPSMRHICHLVTRNHGRLYQKLLQLKHCNAIYYWIRIDFCNQFHLSRF